MLAKLRGRHGLNVLVVDGDPAVRRALREFFEKTHAGEIRAEFAADAGAALAVVRRKPVDVVVLDRDLPGLPGDVLVKALRRGARDASIGIIMIAGNDDPEHEVIEALEAGADDCLSKPYDREVLVERIRSLFRRRSLSFGERLAKTLPGLEFDPETGRLAIDGRVIRLDAKELELFRILASRPGITHAHSFLWESVWGGEADGWAQTLKAAIISLRRKLGRKWGARVGARSSFGYVFDPAP